MARDRNELLEVLLSAYSRWYDLERTEDVPLAAFGAFHETTTGYLLIKAAQMWTAGRHEYIYFFTVPKLTLRIYEDCLTEARSRADSQICPGKGHMCSNVVVVFLADAAEEDAIKALRKCRIRKSFHFSLYGWMEVQTALVETGKESVIANGAGYNTAKFMKNALHPKLKRKR